MKRFAVGAAALALAGMAQSADAADLPYTVNQPLNAFSWAGPYLGGNLGYEWGTVSNNVTKPSGISGGVVETLSNNTARNNAANGSAIVVSSF